MLEQLLALIERGVIALETIAANGTTTIKAPGADKKYKEDDKPVKKAKKEEPEDEPEEKPAKKSKKEEPEEEPAKKPRGKKKADPTAEARERIAKNALIISGGDDDDASDDFDDLLEEYEVKSVDKLDDEDVEDFDADLQDIVDKYF